MYVSRRWLVCGLACCAICPAHAIFPWRPVSALPDALSYGRDVCAIPKLQQNLVAMVAVFTPVCLCGAAQCIEISIHIDVISQPSIGVLQAMSIFVQLWDCVFFLLVCSWATVANAIVGGRWKGNDAFCVEHLMLL